MLPLTDLAGMPLTYYARWLTILAAVIFLVLIGRRRIRWGSFVFEVGLIVTAYWTYYLGRGLTEGSHELAVENGWRLVNFERAVGLYWEREIQDFLLPGQWAITIANWVYIWGFWPIIVITAAGLLIWKPEIYRRYRNAFLISGGLALVLFAVFPAAPPRFLPLGLVDTVEQYSSSYRLLQPPALTNEYAALPSLHFGWVLLIGIAWYRHAKWRIFKVLAFLAPAAMGTAIIVTANHYIIDAVAGAGFGLAGLYLSVHGRDLLRNLRERLAPQTAPEQSGDRRPMR